MRADGKGEGEMKPFVTCANGLEHSSNKEQGTEDCIWEKEREKAIPTWPIPWRLE